MIDELSGFSLGMVNSWEYGIIMTEPPKIVFAEKETESINVPGRSGDLIIDSGRYKNVTVPYKCAILPENDNNLRDEAISALRLLAPTATYKRLENTYHPNYYRMGRIANQISIDSIVEQAGKFTVDFDCKPQRFLKSGEHAIALASAAVLRNPTGFPALPRITVYGTGAGELTVGGVTVQIKALDGHIILDSDTQNAYHVAASGAQENKNADVYAPDFPVLDAGENAVSWSGGITGIAIIPRWWTL